MDARLAGGRSQPHTIRGSERAGGRMSGRTPRSRGEYARILGERRLAYVMKPEDNATTSRTDVFAEQRAVRLNILSRVCVVSVPADVLADISDPASKVPIEIDEGHVEALRQKSTDRALAGSAGADQSNHRIAIGSRSETSRSATMRSSVSCCADCSTLPRESTMPDDPYDTMPSARPATSARMTETPCSIARAMSTSSRVQRCPPSPEEGRCSSV